MRAQSGTISISSYRRFSAAAGLAVALLGLLVLLGWALNIPALKTVLPGLETMKPNAAFSLVLAGVAVWLATGVGSPRREALSKALAGAVGLIAILSLAEYLFQVNLGIDQMLFRDASTSQTSPIPGRMAPNTAFAFLLIAAALILLDSLSLRWQYMSQGLALVAGATGLLALVGYAYGVETLTSPSPYVQMALHTALAFVVLSAGVLHARPDHAFMARITGPGVGALLLRRVLPAAVGVPLLLGGLVRLAERAGAFGSYTDLAFLALLSAGVFLLLTWDTSSYLNRIDQERAQAQAALWQSESRFKAAVEGSLDSFFILESARDSQGRIIDFRFVDLNSRAEKFTGRPRPEMLGRGLAELFPHGRKPGFLDRYVRVVETGEPLEEEFSISTPEIPASWLRHQVVQLGDGIVITLRDVSARRRAQDDLQKERNFVSAVLETAGALVVVIDRQGRIKRFNRACEVATGYAFAEVMDRPFWDLFILPEEREGVQKIVDQLNAGQYPNSHENYWVARDGSLRRIAWSNSALLDGAGEVEFIVATGLDFTERRAAEEERSRLANDLRLLLESTDEGIYGIDLKGNCTFVNASGVRMLGYTQDEPLGKNMHELIHHTCASGKHYFADDCPIFRSFHEGKGVRIDDEVFWRKDGTPFPVEYSSYPIVEDGVIKGAVVTFTDITERKRAEESINQLNRDLSRRATDLVAANKELEAFSYSVSHDLRAPLRSIDGFSQALLEDFGSGLDDDGRDYLRRVRAASQRMGELIDDMLVLSRLTRSDMRREDVDLSRVASGIADGLKATDPDRDVEFAIQPDLHVRGDPRLMSAVLENLLGNAWKFTSRRPSAKIEFGAIEVDGQKSFFVRDNGAGFDMSYVGKLFGAFQRLHGMAEYPGNGIGLATVQRIIHRHGGRVWAEGEIDKGATFWFSF